MELSQSGNRTVMDLPDDILCAIIRCLPMREAVKTSVLSRRWRKLWASALADIDFDEFNMSRFGVPDTSTEQLSHWFVRTVNHFLGLHTASNIHTFRIFFNLGDENNDEYIDQWVTAAIKKHAGKIIFNFRTGLCSFPLFHLDDGRVSSWLKHLHLNSCVLGHYNQVRGLASLKSLTLEYVTFANGQNLHGLISGCSLLESLSLKNVRGMDNIKIDTSFHRLKHLLVRPCSASVVISCLNLVSLEFRSPDGLCLCNDHELYPLKLPIPEEQGGGWFYITTLLSSDLRRFSSLKSVTVHQTAFKGHGMANLFSACPNLESLCLDGCEVFGIPFHHNLKFLDIKSGDFLQEEPDEVEIFCGPNLTSVQWKHFVFYRTTIKLVGCDGRVFSSSSPSPLRKLCLTKCISHRNNYAAFKYLQELTLGPVRLGDDDILSFLSHCSCLERLSLSGGDSRLRHFKVPFPSHPLNYLELKDNNFLEKIELCSTNLTTLVLHTTFMVPLYAEQAPRLTMVSIGSWKMDTRDETIRNIMELSVHIPQLETLTLFLGHSRSALDKDIFVGVPEFKHLKQLVVNLKSDAESVFWMVSLIQIAPNLHTFELHLGDWRNHPKDKCFPNEIEQIKYYHNHLKEVKISGFFGWNYEMEMTIYLLKYAASLEVMTIDPNPWTYEDDGTWSERVVRVSGLQAIRTWLMKHVSSRTKLVIL